MNNLEPINQTKLFGLYDYIKRLIGLYERDILPHKILLSGQKGLGKSTLSYHFINYVLSKNEDYAYDTNNLQINSKNHSFKTILNKSNPNFILIDVKKEKESIDINQIRDLISNLNKSSFNKKKRFVLIDNIEFLSLNSVNALLKILEEPTLNVQFILIGNNKMISPTLLSRCIEFKISLTNSENLEVANNLLDGKLQELISANLINYYMTPGFIFNLAKFGKINEYDLSKINLKELIKILIKNNHYKKDNFIQYMVYDFIEFYFNQINSSLSSKIHNKYSYFLKKISDTKRFNLDEESLFMEFEHEILNG